MPLVTAAFLCLCAGLLAGFAGAAWPVVALVGAVAGLALWKRDARAGALSLVVVAAAMTARDVRRRDAACHAAAAKRGVWAVVLDERAEPRAVARGAVRGGACPLRATLVVRQGTADAGEVVAVRGDASVAGGRVLVRDARLARTGERHVLPALRARAGVLIDRRFGDDAPLVRALVIADAGGIDPEVRDRYAASGLVHALSVSGLHVALVAEALVLLLRAARASPRVASLGAVGAVALYVALIGCPAPAVRAGGMLALDAAARALQRPTSPWAVFAVAAALPLVDPRVVLELGYQLSVAGMAALVAGRVVARELVRRAADADGQPQRPGMIARAEAWLRRAGDGPRVTLLRELVVGTLATAVTAPLVAWHFGQVSLVGPLANLAAAPVLALLQPALFLAVVVAPLDGIGPFVAGAARVPLAALDAVARAGAGTPGAVWHVAPSGGESWLAGMGALALLVAGASVRHRRRALRLAGGALVAATWAPLWPGRDRGVAELHVLDVGQGDAVALRTRRGRWLVVDAGRAWRGGDAGARTVVPWLRARGGVVAALVLTHPHADHVGGAASVLARLHPARVWDPGFVLGSPVYQEVLRAARGAGVPWRRVAPGDSLVLDGMVVTVLAPDSAWTASLDDPNLASVVLSVRVGRVRFLLVGDAEAPEERWLLARAAHDPAVAAALRADVLKVGHHGSATSSTPEFLAAVRPRLALVSVGAGNTYGHPSAHVVRRLQDMGARVLRTDQLGTIVVRARGDAITVQAGAERWELPTRESESELP
ncbi:DNA internalization-related competence protein ComEC/Rec2 [Roseisolibacter agri]|uniref:DNA internalization-related competence protein ComEC/Rec2 n=1 Tax=Roseisolibacter agri TaxID=2014610 RepID=UPI0024E09000|nr:DNA internalization-related competence protein ComEC/Rec2 [Roseisolibacter agri]